MREIRTSGLMSGDGKRGDADMAQATAPVLNSTRDCPDGGFRGPISLPFRRMLGKRSEGSKPASAAHRPAS